jgi:hypothetical protein
VNNKTSTSLSLIFLLTISAIPNVCASTLNLWTLDSDMVLGTTTEVTPYWVTNGYWDAKGFQWGDSQTTYPSGFSCNWQDGIVSVWVGDWEHDYYEGTTVGAVRQGSVWNSTAPWYDYPPACQPAALLFNDTSSITLSSRVRIDNESRTAAGWINWLFNPWFRVMSTFAGVTKERKMVWDIVWGERKYLGLFSTAHNFVDGEQNLQIAFFLSRLAEVGNWYTYTIDLLSMAEQARNSYIPMPGGQSALVKDVWQFEADDLQLWSIDVCVEGFDYNSQYSVDYVQIVWTVSGSPPPNGGGGGCPFVSTWNGSQYVLDNNLIPAAEYSNGTDVTDYYMLQQPLIRSDGKYSLLIWDLNKHSFLDHAQFIAVDHKPDVNVAVSPYGQILTYKNPAPPVSAFNKEGEDILPLLNTKDEQYYQGYFGDYIQLSFAGADIQNGAKLVITSDSCWKYGPCDTPKSPLYIQVLNSAQTWQTVATVYTWLYWSTDVIDMSNYLPDANGQLQIRISLTSADPIDFIGLDTTKQGKYELSYGNLATANHTRLGDVKELLKTSDDIRVELLPGEQFTIQFTLPQNTEEKRDFIIILEGHYFIPN